jgi:hypothetical protein
MDKSLSVAADAWRFLCGQQGIFGEGGSGTPLIDVNQTNFDREGVHYGLSKGNGVKK